MPSHCRHLLALLALCSLVGCTATRSQRAEIANVALPIAPAAHAYVTGSRIPVPMDTSARTPPTVSVQQVIPQRDIELTGQSDLGDALRQLVPELHRAD
jgi:hypothetical protein